MSLQQNIVLPENINWIAFINALETRVGVLPTTYTYINNIELVVLVETAGPEFTLIVVKQIGYHASAKATYYSAIPSVAVRQLATICDIICCMLKSSGLYGGA